MESTELRFWSPSFQILLPIEGHFLLICACLWNSAGTPGALNSSVHWFVQCKNVEECVGMVCTSQTELSPLLLAAHPLAFQSWADYWLIDYWLTHSFVHSYMHIFTLCVYSRR